MKVWVFVEGRSDELALNALWAKWKTDLRKTGWGVKIIPLDDKSRYFRKIGHRAAEKLVNNNKDLVVGLPDLYPNAEYKTTAFKHDNLRELQHVQSRLVADALKTNFNNTTESSEKMINRFYPTALKHDLEVLLLAAVNELRAYLRTTHKLDKWCHPVENQNQTKPPKYVVEELFRTLKKQRYRDTVHASAVLGRVSDIRKLLYNKSNKLECPVFKETMDWIAEKTGVLGY